MSPESDGLPMNSDGSQSNARPRLTLVARASLLIAFFFGVDKLLGLVRQVVIGRQFGVSQELDAFNAANNLPDLLFAVISGGALAIAFIPVLTTTMQHKGRRAAWILFSRVANWAFLLTGGIAVILAIFAGPLVRAEIGVAPGFTPQLQNLVADLMRLNLISTLLFSISGLVIAGLQANQHFLLPALAPVMYDVGQIFGALVLAPEQGYQLGALTLPAFGLGVHGLVYGVILGAALHLAVQIPGLIRLQFRWVPLLGLRDPDLQRVAKLMAPRILTIGAFQAIFVMQDNLASRLDVGSITALAYGWLIMQVPETIFGTAIGTAILPTLSEHFARKDDDAFETAVARAIRIMLALSVPSAALLAAGIRPLVQAAFHFDPRGTELVVWAARAYLFGLLGHSLLEIAARAFYARQNARTPLLATTISAAAFILISLGAFRFLGATGIALSNSLAFTLEAFFLIALLARNFPRILHQGRPMLRIILGSLLGAGTVMALNAFLPLSLVMNGVLALGGGGLVTLPFLLPELRMLPRI